jgi:hypothetical protein
MCLEMLETRTLLSAFYSYDVVAQSGVGNFTGFGNGPSINDAGTVAYVGQHKVGDGLFVKPAGGTSKEIAPSFDNDPSRTFMQTVQINNNGFVVAQARVVGASLKSFIETWNSASPGSFTTSASGDSGGNAKFGAVFPFPSINKTGQTAFGAFNAPTRFLATPTKTIAETGILMPMIADNGNIIVRAGGLTNSPIMLYNNSLGIVQDVADSSMGFKTLGEAPGISDDGKVVVFAGDRGKGQGIFARFLTGSTFGPIVTIAGENTGTAGAGPELGFDDAGKNIFFSSFSLDSRVGVTHADLGGAGLVGDSVDVSFIGTPSASSSTNSRTSSPMLFTNKLGLWSEPVNMDTNLNSLAGALVPHPASALPVVQVGDKIGGQTITGFAVNDPIALATTDASGKARTEHIGDHRVAFYATTSTGSMIVRATHLDSDEDGLLDNWEAPGGGIDINGDGVIDLNLNAMGANPFKRDLFMEVDWTNSRVINGMTISNEPPPGAVHQLVNMFANAPALADGVPAGITLHFDGGPGKDKGGNPFSVNMGSGSLQGGNLITMPDGHTHPDMIYFGVDGKPNGAQVTPGVNERSLASVKKQYFGNDSKNARELAFHYSVLADFWGTTNNAAGVGYTGTAKTGTLTSITAVTAGTRLPGFNGDAILITSGKGAGEIAAVASSVIDGGLAKYNISPSWAVAPDSTSKFAVLTTSSGNSEVSFYAAPDYNSVPGNDTIIALGGWGSNNGVVGNTFFTWRTMAHELGHTLGLRHGGIDHNDMKGAKYKSLMSYSYQTNYKLAPADQVVSYADANAGTFNDWANLQLNFQDYFTSVNNSFQFAAKGASNGDEPEIDVATAAQINGGPLDFTGPAVKFTSPAPSAKVAPNGTLTVKLTATDPSGVASVVVSFDTNGDGKTTGTGETVTATASAGVYTVNFSKVTGALAMRNVSVLATDILGNVSVTTLPIKVGP